MNRRHFLHAALFVAGVLVSESFLLCQGQEDLVSAFYRVFEQKNLESGKVYSIEGEEGVRFEVEAYPGLNPKRLILTKYEEGRNFYSERFIKVGSAGKLGVAGDVYESPDGERYTGGGETNNITEEHAERFGTNLAAVLRGLQTQ